MQRCPCPEDRSRRCFNCGEKDHVVAYCRNRPHCPSCKERGLNASHKPGGPSCTPVYPFRPGQQRSQPARTRAKGKDQLRDGDDPGAAGSTPSTSRGTGIAAGGREDRAFPGSSPLSPPGKKSCVERPPSPEPLPQRKSRHQRNVSPAQSHQSGTEDIEDSTEMDIEPGV